MHGDLWQTKEARMCAILHQGLLIPPYMYLNVDECWLTECLYKKHANPAKVVGSSDSDLSKIDTVYLFCMVIKQYNN